jgi:hypothetical protein
MSSQFNDLIAPFINSISSGQIEIYNEFSLQHELGFFLRSQLPNCKVQFERNVRSLFPNQNSFVKREIDIVLICRNTNELQWAIELKYPRNGQYPEQMFNFCKDIVFLEQLKAASFLNAGLLIFADNHLFSRGPTSGIYGFFRGGRPLHGAFQKPTGSRNAEVTVQGSYNIEWNDISDNLRFAAIEIAAFSST